MAEGRPSERALALLALAVVGTLALLPLSDLVRAHPPRRVADPQYDRASWWVYNPVQRPGDSLLGVIERAPHQKKRYGLHRALYVAELVRTASEGDVGELVVPRDAASLGPGGSPQPNQVLYADYLRLMSGGRTTARDYDPVVSPARLGRLEREGVTFLSPEFGVLVVGPSQAGGRWLLLTDERRSLIYVVPAELSPEGGPDGR